MKAGMQPGSNKGKRVQNSQLIEEHALKATERFGDRKGKAGCT
jgi:hypothetical protein